MALVGDMLTLPEELDQGAAVPRRAFGRIRQLPSGRWQARIADPDGRLRSLGTCATRTAASRALSAHETDAARGAWTAQRASTQTLEAYAAQWLETRALRPRTKEHYADQLRLRILPTLGPVPAVLLDLATHPRLARGPPV